MKEQFANYKQSIALKELGFDEPCLAIYEHEHPHYDKGTFFLSYAHMFTQVELVPQVIDNREPPIYILAPLNQQVFEWFREKHNLFHSIIHHGGVVHPKVSFYYKLSGELIHYRKLGVDGRFIQSNVYGTYEEAESACIDKLIELVKNK